MKFPRWLSTAIQVISGVTAVWTVVSTDVTWDQAKNVTAALAVANVIVTRLAHAYNPDGTPAAEPYVTPPKPQDPPKAP